MNKKLATSAMILMCISAGAQNNKMTHDMTEFYTPEVPVVTPGTDLKGGGFTAPSDAIVLFDGKDYVGESGDGKFIKQKKIKFKGPQL